MQRAIRLKVAVPIVVLVAACFAGSALAQQDAAAEADPIDVALDKCLASPAAESTTGMVECLDTAYAAWDKELNETYRSLSASLDAKSRGLLKRSQRQWVAFRDAEREFWRAPWTADRGSLIRVTLGQENVDLVKSRVLALRGYVGP